MAIVVVAIGVGGLVRAAIPQSVASSPAQTTRSIPTVGASPSGSVSSSPAPSITITGAFVRQPASPAGPASTHLTINNTSAIGDTLISVESGDAAKVQLRVGGSRTPLLTGVKIPPHTRVTIGAGRTRIVITKPFAPLRYGSIQNLQLWFDRAGPIAVPAPVLPASAPVPTATVTR